MLIGNEVEGIKGISGGQKRRLAVGLELVTQPSVVLLDEPTSGLDSEIALTIVRTLKELATKGRTVRVLPWTQASVCSVNILTTVLFGVLLSQIAFVCL